MTDQQAPDPDSQHPVGKITDDELRATLYFAVGVASEGSSRGRNVAYDLSFAGYIHRDGETSRRQPIERGTFRDGQMEPIENSGYSVGTLQTDFGQQGNGGDRSARLLLEAYQEWARSPITGRPEMVLTTVEVEQANQSLQRTGNQIRGDRQVATDNGYDIPAAIKSKLNAFMASDAGISYVHSQDVKQVDLLLRKGGAVRELERTELYSNATQDDQVRMATVIGKLENQAGIRYWPKIREGIENGTISSLEGIKAGIPQRIQGDRDNALRGAELIIALRNSEEDNPLCSAWQSVVENPLVNPTRLDEDSLHQDLAAEYSTIKSLFLVPAQGKSLVQALDEGGHRSQDVHFQGVPRDQAAGLYASGHDFVQWNREGHGHANVGGQWSEIERDQITRVERSNDVVELDIDRGGATERLLQIDPHAVVLGSARRPAGPEPAHRQDPFIPNQATANEMSVAPRGIGGTQATGNGMERHAIDADRLPDHGMEPVRVLPIPGAGEREDRGRGGHDPQASTKGPFNDPALDRYYAAVMGGNSNLADLVAVEFAQSHQGQWLTQHGGELLALESQQAQEQHLIHQQGRQGPVMLR